MDPKRRRQQAQVLRPDQAEQAISIGRADPPDDLAWCIDYLWWVQWNTPTHHAQDVIPRPVVHVAAEAWEGEPRLLVYGVPTNLFERTLDGVGRTVAAAFRPGGFRPFIQAGSVDGGAGDFDVAELSDRTVPAQELFGVDDRPIARAMLDPALAAEDAADDLASWLASLEPQCDPVVDQIAALVERAEADRTIVRAHQLAEIAGVSTRTLERRFRAYVGASPKWVVQRHRLLDVAAAANAGESLDWASLATELGYADQSHLIRHFREVVGEPPARYAEQVDEG